MIHLTKSKTGHMVVTLGKNKKVLATSEVLERKSTAIRNVIAQAEAVQTFLFIFQDDTVSPSVCFEVHHGDIYPTGMKPSKPYSPKKKYKAK